MGCGRSCAGSPWTEPGPELCPELCTAECCCLLCTLCSVTPPGARLSHRAFLLCVLCATMFLESPELRAVLPAPGAPCAGRCALIQQQEVRSCIQLQEQEEVRTDVDFLFNRVSLLLIRNRNIFQFLSLPLKP